MKSILAIALVVFIASVAATETCTGNKRRNCVPTTVTPTTTTDAPTLTCAPCPCGYDIQLTKRRTSDSCLPCKVCTTTPVPITTEVPVEVCSGNKRRNCVPATTVTPTTESPVEVCTGSKRRNCVPSTSEPTNEPATETPVDVCTGAKRRNCLPVEQTDAPGVNQSGDNHAKTSGAPAVVFSIASVIAAAILVL